MRKLVYDLFVSGIPKPQPRPRKGKYGNFYNPDTADAWKAVIQGVFLQNRKLLMQGPVYLTIDFFFHKALGLHGHVIPHTSKPDTDNLIKPVMDTLTALGLWKDDCQVFHVEARKYWTQAAAGAHIWIETEETP